MGSHAACCSVGHAMMAVPRHRLAAPTIEGYGYLRD